MRQQKPLPTVTLIGLCLFSGSCWLLPSAITRPVRNLVRDAFQPAQQTSLRITETMEARWTHTLQCLAAATLEESQDTPPAAAADSRQLILMNAELQEKVKRLEQQLPQPAHSSEPLVIPSLISASTLGRERALLTDTGMLLDVGSKEGAAPDQLVLESPQPLLLDQGSDSGVYSGQPVYSGRCVLGRIAEVSRWTSKVQSVSDVEYRGRAQLVHKSGEEYHFGAEGILAGRGEGTCQLLHIRSSETVAIGDEIYTGGHSGALPTRMYYGRVTAAELKPGAPHWEITVAPAAAGISPKQVCILRHLVNTNRILGH